jgi:MFS family permease
MDEFKIDEAQMGAVGTGALIVGALLYPLWGYLYDRFARARLIALASAIWGVTTWLGAIAPTYITFLGARASTGIDDSSYPGLYSLISDYFGPGVRGKIYGLLQLAQPLGYMLGMVLALAVGAVIGWRNVFFLTGGVGLVLAVLIFFGVREMPRGQAEPELAGLEEIGVHKFDRKLALGLFRKRALLPLFAQGFFGVFPWTVISFWIFRYLEDERGYTSGQVLLTMVPVVLVLAGGYFVGGALGDALFKRTPRGRLMVCMIGIITGAIFLLLALNVPFQTYTGIGVTVQRTPGGEILLSPEAERPAAAANIHQNDILRSVNGVTVAAGAALPDVEALLGGKAGDKEIQVTVTRSETGESYTTAVRLAAIATTSDSNRLLLFVLLCCTALFIPFAAPNVISTVYDITLPEVRSTALAVQYFIENAGAAFAPLLAGIIAVNTSLGNSIVLICVTAWAICFVFVTLATLLVPRDIETLRQQMRERAATERAHQAAEPSKVV